jgi:hypothetical protein
MVQTTGTKGMGRTTVWSVDGRLSTNSVLDKEGLLWFIVSFPARLIIFPLKGLQTPREYWHGGGMLRQHWQNPDGEKA